MQKQDKYLEEVVALPGTDPGLIRYFQRKFKLYHPRRVSELENFYFVRLGHVPRAYTFWKDAQLQTFGVQNKVKGFKTRVHAENFVLSVVSLSQPLHLFPTAPYLLTSRRPQGAGHHMG